MFVEKRSLTVYQAIWPWRQEFASPGEPTGPRRKRAVIQFCGLVVVASLVTFVLHRVWLGALLWVLSGLVLWGRFYLLPGRLISSGLSWLLLAILYYLFFFFPGRLFLLLLRKDPMKRSWRRDRPSYWTDRRRDLTSERYLRQY